MIANASDDAPHEGAVLLSMAASLEADGKTVILISAG
jgi:hypothetical protein